MGRSRFGRVQRATALVPLAVLSAAWTASLVTQGAPTTASAERPPTLPDGSALPLRAIEAPASVTPTRAPASRLTQQAVGLATPNGIPEAALAAYQRAATVINT